MTLRSILLVALASVSIARTASADVSLSLVPAAPPFTTTGANAAIEKAFADANLKAYTLRLTSSDARKIAIVDFASGQKGLSGNFVQKWADPDAPDGTGYFPSANSASVTNMDSHMLAAALGVNAVGAFGLIEDNPAAGITVGVDTLSSTPSFGYGVGTSLTGAWGIAGAAQLTTYDVAYLVFRASDPPSVNGLGMISMSDGSFTTVPEPTALGILCLAATAALTRHRRA